MSETVAKVRDLDLLLGQPITIRLGGVEYKLPADVPAELYLQVLQFSQLAQGDDDLTEDDELALTGQMRDSILELFQVHQPSIERLPMAMSTTLLVQAIGAIYGPEDDGDPTEASPEEAPPAAEKAASTRKAKPKSKSTAAKRRQSSGSSAS